MKRFVAALVFLLIGLSLPYPIDAASITPLGNLHLGESKQVTVSGLETNTQYFWGEEKVKGAVPTESYRFVFKDCYTSDSAGVIRQAVGPFNQAGKYRISISKTVGSCTPVSTQVIQESFTVGEPTGQACCSVTTGVPVYNTKTDKCETVKLPVLPGSTASIPTECSKSGTYCEPDSLQCFKQRSASSVGGGTGGPISVSCTSGGPGIDTALGCIPTENITEFIKWFLSWAIGIAGGIAFLLILWSGFQIMTSSGNPDKLKGGQEQLTAAVSGLLFIIFAVFLLRLIGVEILQIPGF